ncbi:MAG: hypothetical protein QGG92_02195 [Dehalococcoidia bacterium]|nr:hypothetical protein [Dehalococcoidia bacterium]
MPKNWSKNYGISSTPGSRKYGHPVRLYQLPMGRPSPDRVGDQADSFTWPSRDRAVC